MTPEHDSKSEEDCNMRPAKAGHSTYVSHHREVRYCTCETQVGAGVILPGTGPTWSFRMRSSMVLPMMKRTTLMGLYWPKR